MDGCSENAFVDQYGVPGPARVGNGERVFQTPGIKKI